MSTSSLPRILIVDDSRIVRATIIKRIRDRFDAREEVDGEAGWEALLIDPTLQLVITDHTMPRHASMAMGSSSAFVPRA